MFRTKKNDARMNRVFQYQKLALAFLCVSCMTATSCMQFSLAAGGDKAENMRKSQVYYGSMYNFWWGESPEEALLRQIESDKENLASRSLYQARYASNYLFTAASFVSLGLFVPVGVSWYLTTPPAQEYTGEIRRKKTNQ